MRGLMFCATMLSVIFNGLIVVVFSKDVLWGIVATVIHESSHIITACVLGVKVHRVGLSWKGLYIARESGTFRKNLAITLAGPGSNLLSALLWHWFPVFSFCSLLVGLVNLAPIERSDGGRAFLLLRSMCSPASQEAASTVREVSGGV